MRRLLVLVLLPISSVSAQSLRHAACTLRAFEQPIKPNFDDTKEAVRAFERQVGTAYSILYIRKAAGRPDKAKCEFLVQQSATRWQRHTYHAQQVNSSSIRRPLWQQTLTRLKPGHYWPLCESSSTDPVYWILLIKQGETVLFSLSVENAQERDLSATDYARIAPALELIKTLD